MQWTTLLLLLKAENYVHGRNLQGKTVRECFKTIGTLTCVLYEEMYASVTGLLRTSWKVLILLKLFVNRGYNIHFG